MMFLAMTFWPEYVPLLKDRLWLCCTVYAPVCFNYVYCWVYGLKSYNEFNKLLVFGNILHRKMETLLSVVFSLCCCSHSNLQVDIDYETVLKSHVREREGVLPSVLSERPVTFSVLSLCPVFGPMLHINMLGHIISCMWSFTGDLTGAVCTSCVCGAHSGQRERERARERDRERECLCVQNGCHTHTVAESTAREGI